MIEVEPRRILLGLLLGVLCSLTGCARCPSWNPFCGWGHQSRSFAIPETYPLGSTIRAHYHTMETNAEAADFIFHRHEFVGSTAELTPDAKDHVLEVAARMRSAPFPVLIERSENNSDPELDNHRRRLVAQILTDFGVPEADQRTIVAPAYGNGINSQEAEIDYYRFLFTRGSNRFGSGGFGNNFGQFGGAGNRLGGGIGFGP